MSLVFSIFTVTNLQNNHIWCFDQIVFLYTRFKTQDPVLNFKGTLYWEM